MKSYCYKIIFLTGRVKFLENVNDKLKERQGATKGSCIIFLSSNNDSPVEVEFKDIRNGK